MAAAAFSIRGFAASKRGEQAAEGRRPLGIADLPPIEAPKFRWWADELASAVSAARRSPKAKPPKKKRSISDLFAAVPPLPVPPSDESGGGNGQSTEAEEDDDEALYAIARRAKEERKRRRRLRQGEGEASAAAAASADGCGGGRREAEGNFEAAKGAPENQNSPDRLDTQPSQKPEASQYLTEEMENISRRRKQGKINNTKKKKADTVKRVDSNKADKVGKPRDLEKHLPRQSILKIKRTSLKMVKEKHGNSKGKQVIELCRKSVKRVKFSEADDILGSEMQSCELPKRRSLSKLISDAMASSSSSSSSSTSTEGEKFITAECSTHMPKEAVTKTKEANLNSNHEDSPTEGHKCTTEDSSSHMPKEAITKSKEANLNSNHEDSRTEGHECVTAESSSSHMPKEAFSMTQEANLNSNHEDSPTGGHKCITAESSSSHNMPKEAFTKTKEANPNSNHEDSPKPSNTALSSHLIDLNEEALPESTDLNYTHNSNSKVPYLEHPREETLNSDIQLLDGRENRRNLSFDSHRLARLPSAEAGSVRNARSAVTLLQAKQVNVPGIDIVDPPLSIRELGKTHRDCSNVSVKDNMTMSMSPCALPDHTFQDSFQQHQNGFHTNQNHGDSQLSTGGKFPSWSSRELNVQRGSPMGQTLRLMGKDLAVCTTRVETSAETRQQHTGTSTNDYQRTNAVLELPRQGQPFLSLQAQSFPNVTANSTSAIHASTYHSSTSQAHFGHRTPHNFSHPIPAVNVFSGDRLPYENRYGNFSNSQPSQPFLLGCPPLPNNRSATLHPNSPPHWRYYSDPINRTEPPTAPFWPTTRPHGPPSSVFQGSLPQQHIVHSASSSARPFHSVSSTFSHPARVVQEASHSFRGAAVSSRNSENRTGRAIPGNSNASSSGGYAQKRSGPVKLTPGAKHILVPSDSRGDSSSVPVYSCISFGSRSGNAGAPQNKGA